MTTTTLITVALVFYVVVHLLYRRHIRSRKHRFDETVRAHVHRFEDESSRD